MTFLKYTTMERSEEIEHIFDNIAAIRIGMLTSTGEKGELHSRPMYTLEIDDQERLWFFTGKGTLLSKEINEKHQVNIAYADMHSHTYISISGLAYEIDNNKRKNELWDPALEAWFSKGPDSPDVSLMVVELANAAYWEAQESQMKNGIYFQKENPSE